MKTYFYHSDHLGSIGFVTDTDAKPVQHLQYLPFGELFVSQMAGTFDSRYKFTGKERDEETGYDYFGARYYDSDLSQWLSVDPMSDKFISTSPYIFCIGNPVRLVDYNGMDTIPFNNKGDFGKPIPDNNDYDTYVKVNDEEFSANKIEYNKNGQLKKRHSNMQISKDFRKSHFIVTSGNDITDVYTIENYLNAKNIFEFFADNTDVEWAHQILINNTSGEYLNQISTSHNRWQVYIPGFIKDYTPVDIRHSHPALGFLSPADKYLYNFYNTTYGGKVAMRIYKAGFYHNFDDTKEYPNLKIVPGYK